MFEYSHHGKGLFVLRAFPFISRLPSKIIEAQEDAKRMLQNIGQKMLDRDVHENKEAILEV